MVLSTMDAVITLAQIQLDIRMKASTHNRQKHQTYPFRSLNTAVA